MPEDTPLEHQAQPPALGKTAVESGATLPAAVEPSGADESKPVNQMTPEEQMALFEKDLKENDWGHQPC